MSISGQASLSRNRSFVLVWVGQSLSMFGSRLTYIALMWWVLEKTGSASALAGVAIATALPVLFLGPLAGVFVDRLDRRRLMLAMDLANGVIIGTAATLLMIGVLQVWEIYVLTILASTATVFHRPALQSSIPNLVPQDELMRANGLYQLSAGAAGIAGPAVGGILVGMIGSGDTMLVDAVTFLLAAVSLAFASFPSPRIEVKKGLGAILSDLAAGLRFLRDSRILFFMLLLFALINFILAPTSILFPIMAKDVLHAGARGFGLFGSALSLGMVIGGLFTSRAKRGRHRGLLIIGGLALLGVMLAVFGLSRDLSLSLAALGIVGFSVAMVNVTEAVIFQTCVPNDLQGRVFAAQSAITDGLQPISLAATGAILTLLAAPTIIVGCGVAAALAGLGALLVRGMRQL